jgi:hypothetical protein
VHDDTARLLRLDTLGEGSTLAIERRHDHLLPGRVSRARLTQVMDLLLLAPDIQEEILFLPAT